MESVIASNIKKFIDARGMKQKAVAERSGFGEAEFNNMLNGRKVLKAEAIAPICDVLGITPNDLFGINKGV